MKTQLGLKGFAELERTFAGLPKAVGRQFLRETAVEALQPMAEVARRLAPDDPATGPPHDLPSSITVGTKLEKGVQAADEVASRSTVAAYMGPTKDGYPQATMQEFGTERHAPQPYMRPAWEQQKGPTLGRVAEALASRIIGYALTGKRRV